MMTDSIIDSNIDHPVQPRKLGRRGFIGTLGAALAATVAVPLLPAKARHDTSGKMPSSGGQEVFQHGNAFFD